MKMAAIYTRVSSEKQKEEKTIDSQIAALVAYAQEHNYTVPAEWVFRDDGYSGSVLVRPGLERIRDLAAEGQITTLLIYSPDRLSRKYAYQVLLLEEFSRYGVEVIFMKSPQAQSPEEELLLQFQGMIAEYERAQITERSRRGKKHRAKCGKINVLSGAPYGYRYVKKTDQRDAFYEIIAPEAEVVRGIFRLYSHAGLTMGEIARRLTAQGIPTRTRKTSWRRTVIWAILKNPAYKGTACFGKTENIDRQKITRRVRLKGGYSPRSGSHRIRPRDEWIEIPVPALIRAETFDLAQERLQTNKCLSPRRTKEPTLLQGLLVCRECGYAWYRSSTRTSKRQLYYYRCWGADRYRHPDGRVCRLRPIRQDYLDELIWKQITELLANPALIQQEIERRVQEALDSRPTNQRKETLVRELARVQKGIDQLLDAYQEDLLPLTELRKRIPELTKRQSTLKAELKNLEAQALDQKKLFDVSGNLQGFLTQLKISAEKQDVTQRQKIVRNLVKEVLIGEETITIKHAIPIPKTLKPPNLPSSLLCPGRQCVKWCWPGAILSRPRAVPTQRLPA